MVTVDPTNDLPDDTSLYVTFDSGTFVSTGRTFFREDFEDLDLLPFESATEGGGDETDWTDELPEGWERDNTDTPEDGPFEFFGFTVFDKNSWIATAGDQGRGNFDRGTGNVVVADPDEYDDSGEIDDDLFNVFLTTPEVSLDDVAEGSLRLKFDSSFRPYPTMTGLVDVSFDGGATWDNLLTLNDETVEGGTSSLARVNENVALDVNNPAGGDALFRFGMVDAGNDWWWAIDNVSLEAASETEGDPVAGISDSDGWNFHTAPSFSPAPGDTNVSLSANLALTFSREVKLTPGEGNIEIRRSDDDSVFETIAVASDRVSADGNTVTIDPVNDLEPNTQYYVDLDGFSVFDTEPVDGAGITIFSEDFEDLPLQDSGLVGGTDIDDYVVIIEGVLDVQVAGEYTFGANSDDGQLLVIDVEQDGIDDPIVDAIIFDDATHGPQDRLITCGDGEQSCVGNGGDPLDLAVGEYAFEYWYFERGGGSGGEVFYAAGNFEEFDREAFVLVGDDSAGIGVTEAGITATTYKAVVNDDTFDQINSIQRAEELLDGVIEIAEGFPASETIPTADIRNTGGSGRFSDDHPLPGFPVPEPEADFSPEAPEGWTRESNQADSGAPPEFNGWTFLNKDFWITQQGNQDRSTFTKGDNVLAVSDPDAIDDFVEIDPDLYEGFLTTPEISLEGVEPSSVTLEFDSSFRPYPTMVGLVDVSFDGGASWENLLTLNDETVEGGTSSLARADATEVLEVNNPRGGTVQFRWGMTNAGNDWWWAIDNVRVTTAFSGNPIPGIDGSDVWSFTTGDGSGNTLPGDIDGNGTVAFADFLILSAAFGSMVDPPGSGADLDGNGEVGFSDFLILSANFGQSIAPAAQAAAMPAAAVDVALASTEADGEDEDEWEEDLPLFGDPLL